jgi:membrane-associated phospholipid phosphatase
MGPAPARADDALRTHGSRDAAITLAAATSWLTLELFRDRLIASSCRWCDVTSAGGDELNGFDRSARSALRWDDPATAALGSNVALYGGAALTLGLGALSAASEGRAANLGVDAHIVAQSAFLALTLNSLFKIALQRLRPYAHAASMDAGTIAAGVPADHVSFFSGHTTLAFSLAVSAGTVASMRGSDRAPLVLTVGLTSAAATGYLRVAAAEHYMTDVLVGAAVGSLFGIGVPYLLHRGGGGSRDHGLVVGGGPTPGGGELSLSGSF